MKTLVESIFGNDNITSEVHLSLEVIHEQIMIALKKFNLETIIWDDIFSKGYIPQKPGIIDDNENIGDGYFNVTVITPNKYVYRGSKYKNEEVYLTANVCIGMGEKDDHEDETKPYIKRVDMGWMESEVGGLFPHSNVLWDRSGWKRYSPLKTNQINDKTVKTIINYIVGLVDTLLKMMNRDRQMIYDIFHGNEMEGGDPLLYGRKDCYWYIDNVMKKELR